MRLKILAIAGILIILSAVAFAQAAGVAPVTSADIQDFLQSLGGLKGASALGIAAVVTQGVLLLVRSTFGDVMGKYKLVLVYAVTLAAGVLALKISGMSVGAALLHSNTLVALQVLAHQVYKQFLIKKS